MNFLKNRFVILFFICTISVNLFLIPTYPNKVTAPDTTPPVVTIISPQNTTYGDGENIFSVIARNTTEPVVQAWYDYVWYWDGSVYIYDGYWDGSVYVPNTQQMHWNAAMGWWEAESQTWSDGVRKVDVFFRDHAGNVGFASQWFTVDTSIHYISSDYTFTKDHYAPIVVTADNIVIDGNGYTLYGGLWDYGIYIDGRTNVTITDVTTVEWQNGIRIARSSNIKLSGNTIKQSHLEGIVISDSFNNIIEGNTVTQVLDVAEAILFIRSSNNKIYGNTITNNPIFGYIFLVESSHNIIESNALTYNKGGLFLLYSSDNNSIVNNIIANNVRNGTTIYQSSNNLIYNNLIANNAYFGLSISDSSNNLIYHNDFINNTNQATDTNPAANDWHHPGLLEGNYWADYPGVDNGSGTGKHAIAGDGIGDTAIPWPASDYDFYPLVDTTAADTDGDGLSDWMEVAIYGTNPLDPDTDRDGFIDGIEILYGTDPLVPDRADTWRSRAPMPTARAELAAAAVGGKLYAIGGSSHGIFYSTAVEEYTPTTDTWTTRAPLPTGRFLLAAVEVHGKIYAIGGTNESGYSAVMEEYDPITNTWTRKAPMPTARTDFAAAVVGGKIYVMGGYESGIGVSNTMIEYNPYTDSWNSSKPAMSVARYALAAAVVDEKIYSIGGRSIGGTYLSTVEEYDPVTATWNSSKTVMPTGRSELVAVEVDGKIYAIGGWAGTEYFGIVEEYDPVTDSWNSSRTSMPTARAAFAAAVVRGRLYALGGHAQTGPFSTVEEYTPPSFTITPPPVLSNIRASSVTATSAIIEWTTDVETTADWVEYGLDTTYGGGTANATQGSTHVATLTDLTPETTYHYRIYSQGSSAGVLNVSSDHIFITTPQTSDITWSWTYGGEDWDEAYAMIQTTDGGYALAGFTRSFTSSYDFWLLKTNATGGMEWVQTYGGSHLERASSVIETTDGGFALAGHTESYGAGAADFWLVKTNSSGGVEWTQTYGGSSDDYASAVIQTSDGGYILAGDTHSFGAGLRDGWLIKTNSSGGVEWTQTYGRYGDYGWDEIRAVINTTDRGFALVVYTFDYMTFTSDYWLIKTNATGDVEWNQTYDHFVTDIVQTIDGGFALTGGEGDFYLVKTNATGHPEWSWTYGDPYLEEWGRLLLQTIDGGFTLGGIIDPYTTKDVWLVKTNASGVPQWTRTYGNTAADWVYSFIETTDGGFAFAGYTESYGTGGSDAWLVKLPLFQPDPPVMKYIHASSITNTSAVISWRTDIGTMADWVEYGLDTTYGTSVNATHGTTHEAPLINLVPETIYHYRVFSRGDAGLTASTDHTFTVTNQGALQWNWTYGGSLNDEARVVIATTDGGFALIGTTDSYGDFWLVKTDANGNHQWNETYGGSSQEWASSGIQTVDGGFVLAGWTTSFGAEYEDFWLVKTNPSGGVEWNQTYRGAGFDWAQAVIQTSDGGFALAGWTESTEAPFTMNAWVVKTNVSGDVEWNRTYTYSMYWYSEAYSIIQTPDNGFAIAGITSGDAWLLKTDANGNPQWNRTYDGLRFARIYSVIQTTDGGYALAGETQSPGASADDIWLVKTDTNGMPQWNRTYGGSHFDEAYAVIQTTDGGFALAGATESYGAGYSDFWLVKTDARGGPLWNRTYGGLGYDLAYAVIQTTDGGYALTGSTRSYGAGSYDFWLVKTAPVPPETIPPNLSSPNDITFQKGTTGHIINWTVGDRHPNIYEIYKNSLLIDAGSWINGTITWSADGLAEGTYNITIVVRDISSNSVTDTVWVTVNPPTLYISSDYTFTENLSIPIVVTADNIVIDGNGYTLQGPGSGTGFYLYGKNNVTIRNVIITGWTDGIYLYNSANNTISDNTIINTTYTGIYLYFSANNNSLAGNTIMNTNTYGIWLRFSANNNTILDNTLTNSTIGIEIGGCANNTISGNTLTKNSKGISLHFSPNNTFADNTISNTIFGFIIWNSAYNTLTGNVLTNSTENGIYLDGSNNNTLTGNSLTNTTNAGIRFWNSNYNILTGNSLNICYDGISLTSSSNGNKILSNTLTYITNAAILLESAANYNSISSNNITDIYAQIPGKTRYGINIETSSNTTISSNFITNCWMGIALDSALNTHMVDNTINYTTVSSIVLVNSSNTSIFDNTIHESNIVGYFPGILLSSSNYTHISGNLITNSGHGIWLRHSSNYNNISHNAIMHNIEYGIRVYESSISNLIYHNNFIDNGGQASDTNPAANDWYHPGMLEGNYWSDYPGVDNGNGTGKHAIVGDGIGDTNIPWPSSNYDLYPFIYESGWIDTRPPVLSSPADIEYEEGTTGHVISWTVGDLNPRNYTIYNNSVPIDSGDWMSGAIECNVDGLSAGTYNYTIAACDVYNQCAMDMVCVTVVEDLTPPTVMIMSPQNITYATSTIPVYAINTTEPVNTASWRYWNGSWSANQPLTWDGVDKRWEAEDLTWTDGSYQVQVFFTDRAGNVGFATQGFTVDTTPPTDGQIDDPAGWQGSNILTVSWSNFTDAGSGIAGYNVSYDANAPVYVTGTSYTFTNIPDGWHMWHVYAIDNIGNMAHVELGFGVDTTPPTDGHIDGPVGWQASNNLAVTWSGFNDTGSGIAGYYVSYDTENPVYMMEPSHTLTFYNIPDGQHTWYVYAVDKVGNKGYVYELGFGVDTTPPTGGQIDGPVGWQASNNLAVTWSGFNDTGSGIAGHYVSYDANTPVYVTGTSHTFYNIPDGWHTWYINAVDNVSNMGPIRELGFGVDTTPPSGGQIDGPTGWQSSNDLTETWSGFTDTGSGITGYNVSYDADTPIYVTETSHTFYNIPDGWHTWYVYAVDNVGYAGSVRELGFGVDTTPPAVSSPADIKYVEGTVDHNISWVVADLNPGTYTIYNNSVQVASGVWTNGSITCNVDNLSMGTYSFTIFVYDEFDKYVTDTVVVTVFWRWVAFGLDSVNINEGVLVTSGDIGANTVSKGTEVRIETHVSANASLILGDTVLIKPSTTVLDVEYNDLKNSGTILGTEQTPATLPIELPPYPAFTTDLEDPDVLLAKNETITLDPGAYGTLTVSEDGIVIFTGGTYTFQSINAGIQTKLLFAGPSTVMVEDHLIVDEKSEIGPMDENEVGAADIVFYVSGSDRGSTKACKIGKRSVIQANIYAPNGTLWIQEFVVATGAYIGNKVLIGVNVELSLESAFTRIDKTPPELSSPDDVVYEEGTTGHILSWSVGDRHPTTFELYNNSVLAESGSWINGTIAWTVDGLSVGAYNFTLVVRDAYNNSVTDTVWVTVVEAPPELSSPVDITYKKGTAGHVINWMVEGRSPGTYEIYKNSVSVDTGLWTNGLITWNVDSLSVGMHNFTIVIWDMYYNIAKDTVWVSVYDTTLYISYDYTFTEDLDVPIVVTADNLEIDGNSFTLQGPATGGSYPGGPRGYGVYLNGRSNITIANITIKYWTYGIRLESSSNNRILNNTFISNAPAIYLYNSANNQIIGNHLRSNMQNGIQFDSSSNNRISENIIEKTYRGFLVQSSSDNNDINRNIIKTNTLGIEFGSSSNNSIYENCIEANTIGLVFSGSSNNSITENNITACYTGIQLGSSLYNHISENKIDANDWSGIYLRGSSKYNLIDNNTITNNYYVGIQLRSSPSYNKIMDNILINNGNAIELGSSAYNSITGNKIDANTRGFHIWGSSNYNNITNNIINANDWGMGHYDSNNNTISGNTVTNNDIGIFIIYSCKNNSIANNIIKNNRYGIFFESPSHNSIVNNTITHNTYGIRLSAGSSYNTISGNNIKSNTKYGVWIWLSSNNNTVSGNDIMNNNYGTYIRDCSNNIIYHNNFIENSIQASDNSPNKNYWNHPELLEGNYWSDYPGEDLDGDGIGDTNIPWHYDNYPLMVYNPP